MTCHCHDTDPFMEVEHSKVWGVLNSFIQSELTAKGEDGLPLINTRMDGLLPGLKDGVLQARGDLDPLP